MRSIWSMCCLTIFASLGMLLFPALQVMAGADEGGKSDRVMVLETPDGGIQPQAAIDGKGVIHLIYFRGLPSGGDLFYARREPSETRFSPPIRVNSQSGSAIATGTIRGGQIALGKAGRVHVAWNGSIDALPKNPSHGTPMLYARSNENGTAFEPQRNLMRRTTALDGGGTIAADGEGNVYLGWHGRSEGAPAGEVGRRMWLTHSEDEGATFPPEEPAWDRQTGACACCGTRALAARQGTVYVLYRAATNGDERDMYLLTSNDRAAHFRGEAIHPWKLNACPMSSASLAEAGSGVLVAWETKGQVYFRRIDPKSENVTPLVVPPGKSGTRKHPAVASNARGETILVWAEGTGWQKGGALAWQVFDRNGHPNGQQGRIEGGVPVWGLPTVVARPDGTFTIVR
jgi:hypothetical protein